MSRGWLGAAPEEWAYEPGGSSTPRRRSVKVHETSSDSYVPIANSGTGQTVTDPSFDTEPMTRARRCGVAQVCCTGRSGTTRHPPTASTSGVLGTRRHSTTTADTRSRDFPSCIREFDSPHPLRTQPPLRRGFRRSRGECWWPRIRMLHRCCTGQSATWAHLTPDSSNTARSRTGSGRFSTTTTASPDPRRASPAARSSWPRSRSRWAWSR